MDEGVSYAVVVLAAGASRRMGQPKQLLPVDGRPLLRGVVEAAVDAKIGRVYVVLGANADQIRLALAGLPVETIFNAAWEEGMGASLRAGMTAIEGEPVACHGVIVAVGDQPGISAAHFTRLIQMQRSSGKSIVASRSAQRLTPPVLFGPEHFPVLRSLRGDAGARALLQANPEKVAVVEADSLRDLDTPEDYAAFIKHLTS